MMRFFDLEGNEICTQCFITLYSSDYFLKEPGKGLIHGLRRSSEHIENKIMDILDKGIRNQEDVGKILAWKIGKIKHRESEDNKRFVYAKGWEKVETSKTVKLYKDDFPIHEIASFILSQNELEAHAKNNAQDLLNQIKKQGFTRLGSVYMITLLFFMSKGHYPIYDRFAMMSLSAIRDGISPKLGEKKGVNVDFKELPSKDSTKFSGIIDNEMAKYIKMLNDTFGDEWKTNRKIDQALWVYGHLFKMN